MVSIEIIKDKLIDLNGIKLDYSIMKLIPKEIILRHCIIPLYLRNNNLYVAVSENCNEQVLKDIGFLTKRNLIIFEVDKNQIQNVIDNMDKIQDTNLMLEQLSEQYRSKIKPSDFSKISQGNSEASPIVKLVNIIIEQGISFRASDIHIEPMVDIVRVRYRIDGHLIEQFTLPKEILASVSGRIKLQANMDISEKRLPQDGKMTFIYNNENKDLRISTLPTAFGEKLVIRILQGTGKILTLNALGFFSEDLRVIEELLSSTCGIILVTGPTGSGKTTTLYSMLNELNKESNNIVTIEDPIEICLKGINQVNVNTKSGLSFASGLRSILRQDPDIILIGEIRDEETAEIAIRAAITGHLVIATLHTNDAASCISRLLDMGIPRYLLADSLIACVAQRLVRTNCSFCGTSYSPSEEEKRLFALGDEEELIKGNGCLFCSNTGYKNRIITYEIMRINHTLRELINCCSGVDEVRALNKKLGMRTIDENCKLLVKQGKTSYEEYLKVCKSSF